MKYILNMNEIKWLKMVDGMIISGRAKYDDSDETMNQLILLQLVTKIRREL